jgi:hypothetical protein
MADEADRAQETMEGLERHMLAASRKPAPFATGKCLYCDTPVADELLFCDKECHSDYEYEQSVRSKQAATREFFDRPTGILSGFSGDDALTVHKQPLSETFS